MTALSRLCSIPLSRRGQPGKLGGRRREPLDRVGQASYCTPRGPAGLRSTQGKPALQVGAEADQAVDRDADDEVDSGAPIGAEALVAQCGGQVGNEREVVDGLADEDCGEVFEPSSRSRA